MHTKFERLLSKSLTTLKVMTYYLVVHTGPGRNDDNQSEGAALLMIKTKEMSFPVLGTNE